MYVYCTLLTLTSAIHTHIYTVYSTRLTLTTIIQTPLHFTTKKNTSNLYILYIQYIIKKNILHIQYIHRPHTCPTPPKDIHHTYWHTHAVHRRRLHISSVGIYSPLIFPLFPHPLRPHTLDRCIQEKFTVFLHIRLNSFRLFVVVSLTKTYPVELAQVLLVNAFRPLALDQLVCQRVACCFLFIDTCQRVAQVTCKKVITFLPWHLKIVSL